MYAGIDIGTSGVKVIVANDDDRILASATHRLNTLRPHPHWNEQHPDQWWQGVVACFEQANHLKLLAQVEAIGLSGQMLGPVLIDKANQPIRTTILWNDGRASEEASALTNDMPDIGYRTGCRPNPGFVAPKMLWIRRHEPHLLDQIDCILLPKDYIRLKLTGERGMEPTDACGTHFMEARTGQWAPDLIDLCGIERRWLPPVLASTAIGGYLLPDLARQWGLSPKTVVAMGAGDNMAGAIGVGVGNPGDTAISMGTSAVTSIVAAAYQPLPDKAVITHPHAVPENTPDLAKAAEEVWHNGQAENAPLFLPYVNGIRSPHDMPQARGLMLGLDLKTNPAMIGWSVLEGVAFHITEAFNAQQAAGIDAKTVQFIGGGSRSHLWGEMLATLIGLPLNLPVGGEVGASLGAARLARVASGKGELSQTLCSKPKIKKSVEPNLKMASLLNDRFGRFRDLFTLTRKML